MNETFFDKSAIQRGRMSTSKNIGWNHVHLKAGGEEMRGT